MLEQERTIKSLTGQIDKVLKQIEGWEKKEATARKRWNYWYQKDEEVLVKLENLERHGTQKESDLWTRHGKWKNELSPTITSQRDEARKQIVKLKERLINLQQEKKDVIKQLDSLQEQNDELIKNVFSLNTAMVSAIRARNNYLDSYVFNNLTNPDGSLKKKIVYYSSDGLRKVNVQVNKIKIVDSELAERALKLITNFFTGFSEDKLNDADEDVKMVASLTGLLLTESKSYKIGPALGKFLALEIDKVKYPELREAQKLLGDSMRSEDSSAYIRIYERPSKVVKTWRPVKQR